MSMASKIGMAGAAMAATVIVSGATLPAATAADLLAPAPMAAPAAEPLVEWGSGWYLRGDIGPYQDLGVAVSATEPVRKRRGIEASIGAGYQFNDWLRMDATYERFGGRSRSGFLGRVVCPYAARPISGYGFFYNVNDTCNVNGTSSLGVQGGLINAYADLGKFGAITPYVGAGVGVFYHRASATTRFTKTSDGSAYAADLTPTGGAPLAWVDMYGDLISPYPNIAFARQNWDRNYKRTRTSVGFALMAGVAVDISDGFKLDLGYRYLNAGKFNSAPDPVTGKVKSTTLDNHQIKVGLRYQID